MNYLTMVFSLFLVPIVLGVFVIPIIRDLYKEKNPLEIKPKGKKIFASENGNNWNEEFFIYLINHSKSPYYNIYIISEFPKGLNISILPEKSDIVSLGARESGISMGVDFMLSLEDKERNIGITQTVMNNIGPNETKKVKISIKKNDYKKGFDIRFVLGKFSNLPKPIMGKS
jgi:hypothetical protein